MVDWSRRGWGRGLAGGLLGAAVFAIHAMLRDGAGLDGMAASWDEAALGGVFGLLLALGVSATAAWRHERAARQLATHLKRAALNPSRQLPLQSDADLQAILGPLDTLLTTYRKSLVERVALEEAVDTLRELLGRVEADKGVRFTVRGSGSSRNMVGRLTANLHWLTATPALQAFLHATAEDLNARPFLERVHPQDRAPMQSVFAEAAETGEAHNITVRLLPPGQAVAAPELFTCHVCLDIITRYAADNEILHFRCYFEDVTDRVRAEKELRQRTVELSQTNEQLREINQQLEGLKNSYRDLYNHAPVMYFSLDAGGHFIGLNETMLNTLGYERDELYKQPYTRLLPRGLRPQWHGGANGTDDGLPPAHALSREGEVETRWLKKNGSVIDVWIRSVPVRDADGRFVRSRSAAMDVTERNRLSHELRARGDQLERANVELRQINRELEEFTSVVSHDLKEPLRTLQAFSNFLAEDFSGQLGPDGFQYINHLVQASKRLGTLIDDLLSMSSAGRLTHDLHMVDLNDIVATVRRDLADMIQRKNAHLVVAGTLPTIIGDPQRITQLLSNLVGNALKYNASPAPIVTIGQGPSCPPPALAGRGPYFSGTQPPAWTRFAQATVYVRDNGIGIEPRYHEQIFGIFRRLHNSEEYEGTGAGLAICKKIVEGHAGRIWIESQPDQGSTFYFTLPAAPAEVPQPHDRPASAIAAEQETTRPSARDASETHIDTRLETARSRDDEAPVQAAARIMLVEDMPEFGTIVRKISARAGYHVDWLSTAEEAWEVLQHQVPGLVLLDMHLTGMSGGDLCRRLRTLPHLASVPIVLFTHDIFDEQQARELGADRVLSKELLVRPDDWLAALADALQCHTRDQMMNSPR